MRTNCRPRDRSFPWPVVLGGCLLLLTGACAFEPDGPLTVAAATGDVDAVHDYIAAGADLNAADAAGLTPVAWAARRGQVAALQALLRAGAEPHRPSGANRWPPLLHAIHENQPATARLLIEQLPERSRDAEAALVLAAGYGNLELVSVLLEKGTDPRADFGGMNALNNAIGGASDIDYRWPGCEPHLATARALLDAAPDLELGAGFWSARARFNAERRGCDELLALVNG